MKQAEHLGNMLTEEGNMDHDAEIKRAKFIHSAAEIRELFKSAAPAEVIKALKVYTSSFYGSNLWDLGGLKARQVYSLYSMEHFCETGLGLTTADQDLHFAAGPFLWL